MAATPTVNIVIPQGTDFSEIFTSTESDGTATNLSGFSARSKMKKHPGAAVGTAISFTVGITSSTGQIELSLTDTETAAIAEGRYYFDVLLISPEPSSTITRMLEGQVLVTPGIS